MKKFGIVLLSLIITLTTTVSVFAGDAKTVINSFSATCDWSKLGSKIEIGAEIPDAIDKGPSGITDGIIQNLGSDKYVVLYQGWVRKYIAKTGAEEWHSKNQGLNAEGVFVEGVNTHFENEAEYGIGITIFILDNENYKFKDGFSGADISLGDQKFTFYTSDAQSISFVIYAGTIKDIQNKINPKPETGDASNILLYACALLVAMLGSGTVLVVNRSRKKEK